jgi:NADH-quinone oxidoreductase subunit N
VSSSISAYGPAAHGPPGLLELSIQTSDLWAVSAIAMVAAIGVAVLILDLLLEGERRSFIVPFAGNGLALTAAVAWYARFHSPVNGAMLGALDFNTFTIFCATLFLLAGMMCLWISAGFLERNGIAEGPYCALFAFAALGMILMAQAGDLLILFLGLEIMSVSFYVLVGMQGAEPRSPEASLKYFLVGAFSSGVLLYGIALVYGATGTIDLRGLDTRIDGASAVLGRAGLALILAGFLFKIGSVPFHMWAPDVYDGAPSPVTAFLSTGVKAAAFAGLARVLYLGFPGLEDVWRPVLWAVAIATMIVGNLGAVAQDSLKRLLAYSSIAHAGYLLVGLLSVDVGWRDMGGAQAVLFYLVGYTAATVGAFAVIAWSGEGTDSLEYVGDYRGLASRHPGLALMLSLFMLSLAGIPPTVGFTAKYFVFAAAVKKGYVDLAVIGVLTSLVSVYYYLKVVVNMYMREPDADQPFTFTWNLPTAMALYVAAAAVIFFGVMPTGLWGTLGRVISTLR